MWNMLLRVVFYDILEKIGHVKTSIELNKDQIQHHYISVWHQFKMFYSKKCPYIILGIGSGGGLCQHVF